MTRRATVRSWGLLVCLTACLVATAGNRSVLAGCRPSTVSILVDAGHGPRRSGAESARGVPEYAFNTRLADRVVAALRAAGFTRTARLDPSGQDIPPAKRAALANARGAQFLVSLHHDSVQPRYLETWIFPPRSRHRLQKA